MAIGAYLALAIFWLLPPYVTIFLTIVMFGLGVTLTLANFRRVLVRLAPVIARIVIYYLVTPLAAVAIARAMRMAPAPVRR